LLPMAVRAAGMELGRLYSSLVERAIARSRFT
jgi:D-alanine-D-alanine ligase